MTPSAPACAMARTWAGRADAEPDRDRDRRDGRHVADELADGRREGRPGPGDADQRHAVEEAAAAGGDRPPGGPATWSGRRGRRPRSRRPGATASNGAPSSGVRSATMMPAAPARARRLGDGLAVAAADDLVGVAHRDEREVGPGGRRSARSGASEPLERGARPRARRCDARWSVAPSASGSEYGRPTSSRSAPASAAASATSKTRVGVGVAGDDVRDERGPTVGARAREGGGDPAGAGGVVRAGRLGHGARSAGRARSSRASPTARRRRSAPARPGPCRRAREPEQDEDVVRQSRPRPIDPGQQLGQRGDRRARSRAPAGCPRSASRSSSPRRPRGRWPRRPRSGRPRPARRAAGPMPG